MSPTGTATIKLRTRTRGRVRAHLLWWGAIALAGIHAPSAVKLANAAGRAISIEVRTERGTLLGVHRPIVKVAELVKNA